MKSLLALSLALVTIQPALTMANPSDIFIIGADNSDAAIRHLTQLNNTTIPGIEDRARPCAYSQWPQCSSAGFLAKNESLIDRLLADNDYVHAKGLTQGRSCQGELACGMG